MPEIFVAHGPDACYEKDMKTRYALVNGKRTKPLESGLRGTCEICGDEMTARCGEIRIWHWAHKGNRKCDTWWQPESEWHRAWKNQFPDDWQEVVHTGEIGEKHRADVKTDQDWVIEFQQSRIKPDVRRSRDTFYHPKLVWVVNGARRKGDLRQFLIAMNEGKAVGWNSPVQIVFSNKCVLLQDWAGSDAHVFFDFREHGVLWWRFYKSPSGAMYIRRILIKDFVEYHKSGVFGLVAMEYNKQATDFEAQLRRSKPPKNDVKPS